MRDGEDSYEVIVNFDETYYKADSDEELHNVSEEIVETMEYDDESIIDAMKMEGCLIGTQKGYIEGDVQIINVKPRWKYSAAADELCESMRGRYDGR